MNPMRWFSVVLLVVMAGCGSGPARLATGDPAPDFTLPELSGGTLCLSEQQGQVVAVHFWAEQCRFCEGEMRWLQAVYENLRPEGFQLLAVNAGQDRQTAQGFVDRVEVITYPTLLDEESVVTKRYGVMVLPTTILLDRNGIVRRKIIGESEQAVFEAMVRGLLQPGG